jgi:hypothetical protein
MKGKVASDAAVTGVPIAASILLLLESLNNPAASAVATNSTMADVIAVCFPWIPDVVIVSAMADVIAVCFPWVPAVVMSSAVAGSTADVIVLTDVDVPGGCCRRPYCSLQRQFRLYIPFLGIGSSSSRKFID